MGWNYLQPGSSKEDVADGVSRSFVSGVHYVETVEKRLVGSHLWMACRVSDAITGETLRTYVVLALIRYYRGDKSWGYKDMSEHSNPNAVDCPLLILKATESHRPTDPDSIAWRERVRTHHAQKRREKIMPGDRVMTHSLNVRGRRIGLSGFEVIENNNSGKGCFARRRGYLAKDLDTGELFRLLGRHIVQVIPCGGVNQAAAHQGASMARAAAADPAVADLIESINDACASAPAGDQELIQEGEVA